MLDLHFIKLPENGAYLSHVNVQRYAYLLRRNRRGDVILCQPRD